MNFLITGANGLPGQPLTHYLSPSQHNIVATRYSIFRPVFIYGPAWKGLRQNFLHWPKNSLEAQAIVKVVSDQWCTPTSIYDICKGIATIIKRKKEGIYHLAGKKIRTPYQMATTIAAIFGLDETLREHVTSDPFKETVQRARHSGPKIDKAKKELKYNTVGLEEGARRTFNVH